MVVAVPGLGNQKTRGVESWNIPHCFLRHSNLVSVALGILALQGVCSESKQLQQLSARVDSGLHTFSASERDSAMVKENMPLSGQIPSRKANSRDKGVATAKVSRMFHQRRVMMI